jgi:hypothetical protein
MTTVEYLIKFKAEITVVLAIVIGAIFLAYKWVFGKSKITEDTENLGRVNNGHSGKILGNQQDDVDESIKNTTHILFIDDEKFQVVSILKNAGWINTTRVKNIKSVEDQTIKNAQIIFVDINGVAKELFPSDQGLGLAVALKKRYGKAKKVVIYSSEVDGNRFHEAFRLADDQLAKNADSYEFQSTTQRLATQIRNNA